jgi:arylsulfatase A-like enzyme
VVRAAIARVGVALSAGLVAGSTVGAVEALWVLQSMTPSEYQALGYAVLSYGMLGGGIGLALGIVLAPLSALGAARRWTTVAVLVAGGMGGWLLQALLRAGPYAGRDVPPQVQVATLAALAALALLTSWIGTNLLLKTPLRVVPGLRGTVALWGGGLSLAGLFSAMPAPGAGTEAVPRRSQGADLARHPDVLLVIVDGLRSDAPSPALDRLAADGLRFDQVVAASSRCRTAVASLYSALDPASHTCLAPGASLPPEARTLAEVFQEAGYTTAGFPATAALSGAWGLAQGFDVYPYVAPAPLGARESTLRLTLYRALRRGWERLQPERRVEEEQVPAAAQVEEARRFWGATQGARNLVVLHLAEPAEPWFRWPGDGTRLDAHAGDAEAVRARYLEEVGEVDRRLGELLDGLRADGRYADMLIAVTADHGVELGEHGASGAGTTLYDEQLRVPLVLKLPRGERAGTRVGWQVRQIDVAPTLVELAGLVPDEIGRASCRERVS